jgi:hypothetical protein
MGGKRMMEKPNAEYLELIGDLAERKFFGDLTLHFQAGVIDHSQKTERNTAKEIREQMEAKRHRKVLHTAKKGEDNGKPKCI